MENTNIDSIQNNSNINSNSIINDGSENANLKDEEIVPNSNQFDMKSFAYTIIIGLVLNVIFLLLVGNKYDNFLLPSLGMMSLFMITGALVGIKSQDITILEPGLGSIFVSIIIFILIPILDLSSFDALVESDWMIIMMNNIILTFVGAWLGEVLFAGFNGQELHSIEITNSNKHISWNWVLAGTVLGIILSMIVVNIFGLILNMNFYILISIICITFVLIGVIIGRLSPGVTITESGIAGFLVMIVDINLFRATHDVIPIEFIIGSLLGAFVMTYLGGYFGEKLQTNSQSNA